jgi:hypothetical protein
MDVQTHKWVSMKQWWNDTDTGKQKWLEKSLLHYHFVYQKFHMDWPAQKWASIMKGWWLSMLANIVYPTQHCSKHLQHCTKAHLIYRKVRKGKNNTGIIIRITPTLLLVGITNHNLSIFLKVFQATSSHGICLNVSQTNAKNSLFQCPSVFA